MRLLYLTYSRLPTEKAHGKQIIKTCAALAEAGVSVMLVHPYRKNVINESIFSFYNVPKIFTEEAINLPNPFLFGRLGFVLFQFVFALKARLRFGSQWDHIYTRDPWVALLASSLFSSVIWEAHQAETGPLGRMLARKKNVRLIAITRGIINDQHANKCAFSKEDVIADAADPFTPPSEDVVRALRDTLSLSPGTRTIVYAGSIALYPWKGIDLLINIAQILPASWKMLILGGTIEQIQDWQKKAGANLCFWYPAVRPTEVSTWYALADALILPNRAGDANSERYTSPMKLFEYLTTKKPILASRLPSIQEVVSEQEVWFMDPEDPLPDVKRFIAAFEKDNLSFMAGQAYKKSTDYSWKKRAEQIKAFLNEPVAPVRKSS